MGSGFSCEPDGKRYLHCELEVSDEARWGRGEILMVFCEKH